MKNSFITIALIFFLSSKAEFKVQNKSAYFKGINIYCRKDTSITKNELHLELKNDSLKNVLQERLNSILLVPKKLRPNSQLTKLF